MEYLDIYDSEGKPLGMRIPKKEAHDKGLWHRAAHVWIVNSGGEVLIQRHSPFIDNYPNAWDISAAGHVSAGEDDITSAVRETEEEIGLKIPPGDFVFIGTVKQMTAREGYINNEINPVYVVRKDLDVTQLKKQAEEVSDVNFIPLVELQRMVAAKDPSLVPHPDEFTLLFSYLNKMVAPK